MKVHALSRAMGKSVSAKAKMEPHEMLRRGYSHD